MVTRALLPARWLLMVGIFSLNQAQAHDLGTQGQVFPIEELDPISLIQAKLKDLKESGELEHHNRKLLEKTKESIERPAPVKGIPRATKSRIFYYDPSYVVERDLTDHKGNIFAKAGTRINPLKTVSLSQNLLFFDGDDPDQKAWAEEQVKGASTKPVKLILVKGAPLALAKEWGRPVYFDQGGVLIKKLGITYVPTQVSQEGFRLRGEEIILTFSTPEERK